MTTEYDEQSETDDEDINMQATLINVGVGVVSHYMKNILKEPCRDSAHTGGMFIKEILNGHERRCHEMFRMEKHVFIKLCHKLRELGLRDTRGVSVEEAVGMFLMTLGHGVGNRMIQEQFQHSGETVSRQFSNVLKYMTLLTPELIKPNENYNDVPYHIRNNPMYWPYFKNCIGAIDGTHVRLTIPVEEQTPYIGRKGCTTTNIMAVCNFDLQFTFVWPGWEGTAHDTRIFYEALRDTRLKFPKPPLNKYYLVDSGYPNMKGYLAPYRGERYHLPEFRSKQPRGPKEIFNKAHSSLRSAIERTFGVWKARWKILDRMPFYPYDKQIAIIAASMALHNFIRTEAIVDVDYEEYDSDDEEEEEEEEEESEPVRITMDDTEMGIVRDKITRDLMNG